MKFPPLDFSRVKTYPLAQRSSKVARSLLGQPWRSGGTLQEFLRHLPQTLAAGDLLDIVKRIAIAVRAGRPVVLRHGRPCIESWAFSSDYRPA